VGDHDDGHTKRGLKFMHVPENLLAVDAVKISGWFIGKQN
jgi:hypothetical protein